MGKCSKDCKGHGPRWWASELGKKPRTIHRWMKETRTDKPRLEFDARGLKDIIISHQQMTAYLKAVESYLVNRSKAA